MSNFDPVISMLNLQLIDRFGYIDILASFNLSVKSKRTHVRLKKINDGFPLTGPKFEGSVGREIFFFYFFFLGFEPISHMQLDVMLIITCCGIICLQFHVR